MQEINGMGWGPLKEICYRKDSRLTKENRKSFQKRVKKAFISWLAYKGYLPEACKNGQLPQWLDVHHIHPLGGGGDNEFSNLVIIPKTRHVKMNRQFFDCVGDLKEGESRNIVVPSFVDGRGNPLFVDYEGIREYQKLLALSGRKCDSEWVHLCDSGRGHGPVRKGSPTRGHGPVRKGGPNQKGGR